MANAQNGFDLDTAPDIATIEDQGNLIHLKDAAGDPMYYGADAEGNGGKPVTWTVAGTYSHTYRAITKEHRRRTTKRLASGDDLVDATEGNAVDIIAACSKAWDGFFSAGVPLPLTKENALTILKHPKAQHIRQQVESAMSAHERFFGQS